MFHTNVMQYNGKKYISGIRQQLYITIFEAHAKKEGCTYSIFHIRKIELSFIMVIRKHMRCSVIIKQLSFEQKIGYV